MSTFRRPELLRKTLAFIRNQTFRNFEVVISDNDPECSAESIVAEFRDPRFRYFPNKTNLGMVKSFNKSIERSRGIFVVMSTDDDPVYPNMLQVLYDLSLRNPGYGMYSGGHDTVFTGLLQAGMAKARVGTNSALCDLELGAEKVFPATEFSQVFMDGTVGGSMLWSTCVVRRDIALTIGGMPDYGSPHLADCGFMLLSGTKTGCVYVNTSLGYRTIHDANYSYSEANYESIYTAPGAFYEWILGRMPPAMNNPQFQQLLANYVGRDLTVVVISIKKMLMMQHIKSDKFEDFRRRIFLLPFFRRWKRKYFVAVHYPNLFRLYLDIRQMIFPPPQKEAGI